MEDYFEWFLRIWKNNVRLLIRLLGSSRSWHNRVTAPRDTIVYSAWPDLWPANSPDLNPVDYSIWGCVQQRVYQKPVNDVSQLKQRLTDIWSGVQQTK